MSDKQSVSVPKTMLAAFINETGGVDKIQIGWLPTPRPRRGEVLVRMVASEVNNVDLFVRSGAYPTDMSFPFVIGRDLVGTVVETGEGAGRFEAGDTVWTNSLGYDGRQGAFAEYAIVEANRLYPLPAGIDPLMAVSVLHTGATACIGLDRVANSKGGETILVGGAAGGVGSAVVQIASARGVRVIATASPRDADWCRACGASVVLDYNAPNLAEQIRAFAPKGIDIWWDTSGHHDFEAALAHLRLGGRIIVMASMGATPTLPIGALYTKDASIRGFAISNASVDDLADAARTINMLIPIGGLRGRIAATLPLSEAPRAHQQIASGRPRGRIVITP